MSTIQNLRKSLARNWKLVCSLVGDAISGAKFAPFSSPCLLPLEGVGQSAAGLLFSGIPPVLLSGNRQVVPKFRAFPKLILSLLLSHSLSCYLTLAPSDCTQGIQTQSLPSAMPPAPLCSAPTCWWWMWVYEVLFCWELLLGMYSVGFIFPPLEVALRDLKFPPDPPVEGFLVFGSFLY